MRDFLKSSAGRVRAGWFLPLVLLALPNCTLDTTGLQSVYGFNAGSEPLSSAVMCDIPKVPDPSNPESCADASDLGIGMSKSYAGIALAQGEHNSLALDFSADATAACNGLPRKTEYFGQFPEGYAVCFNCPQMMPAVYADANAVCEFKCRELVSVSGPEPPGGVEAYCAANARVATNFAKNICYAGACSDSGTLKKDFPDPRREQEPVKWIDTLGTIAPSNTLTRTLATNGFFNAGGASAQKIQSGDAWIDFAASQTGMGHVLGVSHDEGGSDIDPSYSDIEFGISLDADNNVYIFEGGNVAAGVGGTFGTYQADERFQVYIKDNNDANHTASISYYRVNGSCTAGAPCNRTLISNQISATPPKYPLRVDASLGAQDAALKFVTMVRIQ